MNDDILFYEKQLFGRNWLLLFSLIPLNVIYIWGFIQQVIFGTVWGHIPMSNLGLCIKLVCVLLISSILLFSKLQTVITEEGVYVKYFWIGFRTKFFAWEDIEEAFVRQYRPLREYGGWGIRRGFWKKGIAYNVSGNIGLQLVFKNGKKVLIGTNNIGTNNPDKLEEVLRKLDGKRKQK